MSFSWILIFQTKLRNIFEITLFVEKFYPNSGLTG